MKTASKIVNQANAWIGLKESDGSFKQIIDIYNAFTPLPRGYKMKYTDAWCATFITALAIKVGYTDIIPRECSCGQMIDLFKTMRCWVEDENRIPNIGDIVFYDWGDNGKGNNTGWPEHVGIVSEVNGNSFKVIEGNKDNAVGTRTMTINAKYLRGYGCPKYDSEPVADKGEDKATVYTVQKGDTLSKIAKLHNVTVEVIMEANSDLIKDKNVISVGWKITIPSDSKPSENVPTVSNPSETDIRHELRDELRKCLDEIGDLESFKKILQLI